MSVIARDGRVATETARPREEGARIGVLENIGLVAKVAEDEDPDAVNYRRAKAYEPIIEALRERGVGDSAMRSRADVWGWSVPGTDDWDYEKIYDLARTNKLKVDLRGDRADFEAWHTGRQGQYQQNVQRLARDGRWYVDMPLGLVQSFQPEYGPLPGAGLPAKTIWGAAAKEAVTNMIFEGVEIARTKGARDTLGNPITVEEAGTRVGLAAIAGGALGGAVKGVELKAPAIGARVDRLIGDNWDSLPEAVRSRLAAGRWEKMSPAEREQWRATMTIDEKDLPDLAEALVGRGSMSAQEKAAIDALRRESEIAGNSPFKPGMAGDDAHRVRLDAALGALLQPVERAPRAFAPPVRPEIGGGSAPISGAAGDARSAVKARIARAESGGTVNPDIAKNPLSSATGKYQFVSDTWLRYYKRRFGDQGLTNAQILAKRSDGRIQDALMDDLTADNAAFLRSAGEAETAGNLYLVHFAGQGGARKLFAADAGAGAIDVLGERVVRANPWMRDMSAGDVIAWAHRKMNEPAPRRAGARSELADSEADIVYRDQMQREIDRIDAETDAAFAARQAEDGIGDAVDAIGARTVSAANEMVPIDLDPVDLPVPSKLEPDIAAVGLSDRQAALLPALRAELNGADVVDVSALSKRLQASEAEVRDLAQRIGDADGIVRPIAADLADAEPLMLSRQGFARQMEGEAAADGEGLPRSEASIQRIDEILAVSSTESAGIKISDRGQQFLTDLTHDQTGFFSAADGALVERIGKRIALADGKKAADRIHMAEAATYVQDARTQRAADDVPADPLDDAPFDPASTWERPDDAVAVAQADSVRHDLDAKLDGPRGEQMAFRFDEGGEARSWADIAAELADDEKELDAVRACL